MKLNYKIEYNHTYEEYIKKINPIFDAHIKITLEEAQEFDKKFHSCSYDPEQKKMIYQYRILNNKTWWFINNAFYEIPTKRTSNK